MDEVRAAVGMDWMSNPAHQSDHRRAAEDKEPSEKERLVQEAAARRQARAAQKRAAQRRKLSALLRGCKRPHD